MYKLKLILKYLVLYRFHYYSLRYYYNFFKTQLRRWIITGFRDLMPINYQGGNFYYRLKI